MVPCKPMETMFFFLKAPEISVFKLGEAQKRNHTPQGELDHPAQSNIKLANPWKQASKSTKKT